MKKRNFVSLLMISTMVLSSMSATMTAVAAESKNDSQTEQKGEQKDALEGRSEELADTATRAEETIDLVEVLQNPTFGNPCSTTVSQQTGKDVSPEAYGWHVYYGIQSPTPTKLSALNPDALSEAQIVDTYKKVTMYNSGAQSINYFPLRDMKTGKLIEYVGINPRSDTSLSFFNTNNGWGVFTQTIDTIPGQRYSLDKIQTNKQTVWPLPTYTAFAAYDGDSDFVGSNNLIKEVSVNVASGSSSWINSTLDFVAVSDKTTISIGNTGKGNTNNQACYARIILTTRVGGDVTTEYVTTSGTALASKSVVSYDYRQPYQAPERAFDGYVLKAVEGNPSGLMGEKEKIRVKFIYEKAPGKPVTVNYKDTEGDVIESVELVGPHGDPWTAEEKEIPGYELVDKPEVTTGIYGDEPVTLEYIYKKLLPGEVLVEYVDEEGINIDDSEVLSGLHGTTYTTTAKEFEGFKLKTTPANANGTFDQDKAQKVTYVYERLAGGDITVKYVDQAGKELAATETITGKFGTTYDSNPKPINGYFLTEEPANAAGTFTMSGQTVTYVYEAQDAAPVTVNYVDQNGKEIADPETVTGKFNDPYNTEQKAITGYEFSGLATGSAATTGTLTMEPQTVTYQYQAKQAAPVTVRYEDTKGNVIEESQLTGLFGEEYTTEAKDLTGYTLKTTPDNATGIYSMDAQTVTYVYEAQSAAAVTVKYVDQTGKVLDSATLNGEFGGTYTAEEKAFTGYELTGLATGSAPQTGTFTMEPQTVTFQYQAKQAAPVTVRYEDTNGNVLAEEVLSEGVFGEAYTTEAKEFTGYALKTTPENANGTYSMDAQTVTYVYQAGEGQAITVKFINQEGNEISASKTLTGKVGETKSATAPAVYGYDLVSEKTQSMQITSEAQFMVFEYVGKAAGKLTIQYEDIDSGERITGDTAISGGKTGDPYQAVVKEVPGYTVVDASAATGFRPFASSTKTIYYKKNPTISFELNYVGVMQQTVVGFMPAGVTTDSVALFVKKAGTENWEDVAYSAVPNAANGFFQIESRFVNGTKTFLLENQDQVKVAFKGKDGNDYEAIKVVQPYSAPVVNEYTAGEEYVTGNVPNGANYIRLSVNGIPMRTAQLSADFNPLSRLMADVGGINAKTGNFAIYGKTYSSTGDINNPANKYMPTESGDLLKLDYGVQIQGAQNNPSTTISVK